MHKWHIVVLGNFILFPSQESNTTIAELVGKITHTVLNIGLVAAAPARPILMAL